MDTTAMRGLTWWVSRPARGVRLALAGVWLVVGGWLWQMARSGAAVHLASLGLSLTVAVVALRVIAAPAHIDSGITSAPREVAPVRTPVAAVRDPDVVPLSRAEVRPTYVVAGSDEQAAEVARALHDAMRDARDSGLPVEEGYRNARVVVIATAEAEEAFRRAIDETDLQRQVSSLPNARVVDLRGSISPDPPR